MMELTDNTLSVLKNFSGINQNLLIKEGNQIKTISEAKNILAAATVTESFPQSFGIYDLNEFIGVIGLVNDPSLRFDDESVTVSDASGRSKVRYFFSPEETLTTPKKDINMPDAEVKFTLDSDTLNKIKRAASTLGHDEMSVSVRDGVLTLSVVENQNSTSNAFSIDVDGEFSNENFNFIMSIANLKMIPGDYAVEMSSKFISRFAHKEMNVQYWIALEKTSTFGG